MEPTVPAGGPCSHPQEQGLWRTLKLVQPQGAVATPGTCCQTPGTYPGDPEMEEPTVVARRAAAS